MAQSLPHTCPRCGTEAVSKQKFCPKCGQEMSEELLVSPSDPLVIQASSPEDTIATTPTQMLPQSQVQESPQPSLRPQTQSASPSPSRLKRRQVNMKLVRNLLALIVVLIVIGFIGVELLLALFAPRQPAITTTRLGTTVNYAGVDITVVNAQKSQSFLDDPDSASDGMLRLQLRAQNNTALTINLPYETIAHVTLPDGKVVGPTYVKSGERMAPHTTGSHVVDFAVPQNVRVDQVIFQLGGADEAQLAIPLNGHANVEQYASKTIHPDQQISYYGLNWSLTDATVQFHLDGKQASKGMRYLILTLKVDNPLFQTAIPGSPYGYVQLQASDTAMKLVDTTLPVAFETGASGKIGTLTFLVPQGDTAFALTLSNQAEGFGGGNTNDTATFQL